MPQSRIAYHFAHLLPFDLTHFDNANDSEDGAKASGEGAVHPHTRHKAGSNIRLGQREVGLRISTTAAERIRQAPANAFLATGRKRNRKVWVPAFEAAFLAFYRLNDVKAILTNELLLEEDHLIRAAQGISKNDLRLSNGWLHKLKTRHGIHQHVLHGEADSDDRTQLAVNRMELTDLIGQYSPRDVFNFDDQLSSIAYLQKDTGNG